MAPKISKNRQVEKPASSEFVPIFGNSSKRQGQETQNAVSALTDAQSNYLDLFNDPSITQQLGPSLAAQAQGNQEGKDASLAALRALMARSKQGLTMQDLADINNLRINNSERLRAQNDQILQEAAQRGSLTTGNTIAAQQAAAQSAANRQQQGDLDIAGQASSNALNAALGAGNLGTQIDQNEFNQNYQRGSAQDAVDQFNTALTQQGFQNKTDLTNFVTNLEQNKQQIRLNNAGVQTQLAGNTRGAVGEGVGALVGFMAGGFPGAKKGAEKGKDLAKGSG